LVYPNSNVGALVKKIVMLARDSRKIEEMSHASLRVAHEMQEEISVSGFLSAVSNAFDRSQIVRNAS
jgi:hypothetical protein